MYNVPYIFYSVPSKYIIWLVTWKYAVNILIDVPDDEIGNLISDIV